MAASLWRRYARNKVVVFDVAALGRVLVEEVALCGTMSRILDSTIVEVFSTVGHAARDFRNIPRR